MANRNAPAETTPAGDTETKDNRPSPFQRFKNQLEIEASMNRSTLSAKDVAQTIIATMVEADSLDAAFAAQDLGLASGMDMVDVPQDIHDFEFVESDQQYKGSSALGVYVRVTSAVKIDDGSQIQWATGSANIVGLLWKARETGALPLRCVVKSKPTPNGTLLLLKRVDGGPRVVKGETVPAQTAPTSDQPEY